MNLFSTSSVSNYWERFPVSLRLIIKTRFWTAIGAGGVLYLSPIIFNTLGFTAEQIGSGITTAAFAGITTRLGTGYLLDKKLSYTKAIEAACFKKLKTQTARLMKNYPKMSFDKTGGF